MKTKWFVMAMLTVLMGLSVLVVQVEAMTLDMSSSAMLDEGGGGTVPEPAELYPVAMSDDGGGAVADPNAVPAE